MPAPSQLRVGVGPIAPTQHGVVQPMTGARWAPGLHADIVARNRDVTIPHGIRMLETAGNLRNLRRLAGAHDGPFEGPKFADSDIFKTLEAIAWELGHAHDAELQRFYDETADLLIEVQRPDGYLNSAYQLGEPFGQPWSDFVHGHELYCLGHLIQAAVAGARAIGDDRLLGVAQRYVAHVDDLFGRDSEVYCGHPEIETALVELYRLTGDERALALAESFVRRRGKGFVGGGPFGAQYYQDDATVLETDIMRGHAVRAMYLNAGVADLALETADAELQASLERQWNDLVAHRLYITGGTGSRHRDEAFGDAFELPSERAYAETCAGIALVNWAWRMYLLAGEARYLDELERALYNVVLAGISQSGDSFFYSNPLQLRSDHGASQEESAGSRLSWYWCACCPPNLMRVFASLEHLMFARRGSEVQIAGFGNATLPLGDGAELVMRSDYPRDGRIVLTLYGDPGPGSLALRVPSWVSGGVSVRADGIESAATVEDGWLRLGALAEIGRVEIDLPMPVESWRPNPGIDALRGAIAFTRGPLVYCADQADNALDVERVVVDSAGEVVEAMYVDAALAPLLHLEVDELVDAPAALPLYERAGVRRRSTARADARLVLRPYATWGNGSAPTAMKVWLPEA